MLQPLTRGEGHFGPCSNTPASSHSSARSAFPAALAFVNYSGIASMLPRLLLVDIADDPPTGRLLNETEAVVVEGADGIVLNKTDHAGRGHDSHEV